MSVPFRGRMEEAEEVDARVNRPMNTATKAKRVTATAAAEAEDPKQLTFQLISLNPLQNKLKLAHWKERHRLMGARVKRGERADIRTLSKSEGTYGNHGKLSGNSG
jgi:hypothetical protein